MKDLTGHPDIYRQIPVKLQDGDGAVSYLTCHLARATSRYYERIFLLVIYQCGK